MSLIAYLITGLIIGGVGKPVFDAIAPAVKEGINQITIKYRHHFEDRDFLILGVKQVGKSVMNLFLKTGRPLNLDGTRPEETVGSQKPIAGVYVNNDLNLEFMRSSERVSEDVGGEHTEIWKELIERINPHGIVYMVDVRTKSDDLSELVNDIFIHVLSQYTKGLRNLRALHIFVNFCDLVSPHEAHSKSQAISNYFRKEFSNPRYKHLERLKTQVAPVSLDPEASEWPEIEKALEQFGLDMRRL